MELAVGQTRELNLVLQTGDVTAIVNIATSEVEPATIDQSSNRLGVNISSKEVEQLPVNGRNYSQLYLNAPGAVNTGTGNFNDLRFNGRSNQQNQTKLDGIESSAIFDASPGGNASRNTRRPNLIPGVDPFITIDGTNMRYLNPAAFSMPAPGNMAT